MKSKTACAVLIASICCAGPLIAQAGPQHVSVDVNAGVRADVFFPIVDHGAFVVGVRSAVLPNFNGEYFSPNGLSVGIGVE